MIYFTVGPLRYVLVIYTALLSKVSGKDNSKDTAIKQSIRINNDKNGEEMTGGPKRGQNIKLTLKGIKSIDEMLLRSWDKRGIKIRH